MRNANLLIGQFCKQGYGIKKLQETLDDVPKTSDPQSIFV